MLAIEWNFTLLALVSSLLLYNQALSYAEAKGSEVRNHQKMWLEQEKISFFFYLNHNMFIYRREKKNLFSPLQYDNSS